MAHNAADRQLMMDAVARYAFGYDEGDFELLGEAFTADATSGGVCKGTDIKWGPMQGREEIVSVLRSIRETQTDQRRHNIVNFLFLSQTERHASARLYLDCNSTENGQTIVVTAGTYEADFEKDGEVWRMSRLDGVLDKSFA